MFTHQCPSCNQTVEWPEFVPAIKNPSKETALLLATTGTLIPWISQCPRCQGTFSKADILMEKRYEQHVTAPLDLSPWGHPVQAQGQGS